MKAEDINMYKQTYASNQQAIMWYKSAIKINAIKADNDTNRTYAAFLRRRVRQAQAENRWLQANVPGINY